MNLVGFEDLTTVVIKSSIFWVLLATCFHAGFLFGFFFFDPEGGGRLTLNGVSGVIILEDRTLHCEPCQKSQQQQQSL
jgi:hypothetical protein